MANLFSLQFLYFLLTVSTLVFNISGYAEEEERQVYIVYMGALPQQKEYSVSSYHMNMLQQVVDNRFVSRSLVRSYNKSFNAFAANLTNKERDTLASFKEVVSIFPSRALKTQTTRSWDFMGFHQNVDRKLTSESNIIVGVFDTGIWPESPSFNDEGLGPPPEKWKGVCNGGKNFTCNRKLIGARYYGSDSAIDDVGHGCQTASTATGREVKYASFYGLGIGTARGAVPSARIAAYKVCFPQCFDTAILAAFDDAIADGVDIISISIAAGYPTDIKNDAIAIGAFHAMQKGVLTVQSAGNKGPRPGHIESVAPWVFTAGASSIDRLFINKVGLGNGEVIEGGAIDTFERGKTKFPLVYGKDVSNTCSELDSQKCKDGCLNSGLVKNKIVVCNESVRSYEAYLAGAAGLIRTSNSSPYITPFPESWLTPNNIILLLNYINFTKQAGGTPEAYISTSKSICNRRAPMVASFSSRGPNSIIPDILKPDVTAPGSQILAASSPLVSPTSIDTDKRRVNYSISSGTSISCPHVSGAAAYVKSFHPNWSPAAIKSALMTTAWDLKKRKTLDTEFAFGAGHINPARAVNPGLIYNTSKNDYIKLLCGLGYDTTIIRQITGDNSSSCCPTTDNAKTKHIDLNYPSMAVKVGKNKAFSVKFLRTVTNVGHIKSKYKVKIIKSSNIVIVVKPRILRFKAMNERKSFIVSVKGKICGANMVAASITWSDGIHKVRSPIVVYDDSAYDDSISHK